MVADISDRSVGNDDTTPAAGGDANSDANSEDSKANDASGGASGGAGTDSSTGGSSDLVFARIFGDGEDQQANGLAGDAETGHVVLTGEFKGQLSFGNGVPSFVSEGVGFNGFAARFDSDGEALWAKRLGSNPIVSAALATDTRTVLYGTFSGTLDLGDGSPLVAKQPWDFYLAVIGADGSVDATRTYLGATGEPHAVASGDSEILVAGNFNMELDFGGVAAPLSTSGNAAYLAKLDMSGAGIWARGFPGCPALKPKAVARASNGTIAVVASFNLDCEIDGWVLATGGGLASADCIALTLDPSGMVTWAVKMSSQHCAPRGVAFTSNFSVAMAGDTLGNSPKWPWPEGNDPDIFAFVEHPEFGTDWGAKLERVGIDQATSIGVDVYDRVFVGGNVPSGLLVAQLHKLGSPWSKEFTPSPFSDPGTFVAVSPTGITLAGSLKAPADFGDGVLTPAGLDVFLVKYKLPDLPDSGR